MRNNNERAFTKGALKFQLIDGSVSVNYKLLQVLFTSVKVKVVLSEPNLLNIQISLCMNQKATHEYNGATIAKAKARAAQEASELLVDGWQVQCKQWRTLCMCSTIHVHILMSTSIKI